MDIIDVLDKIGYSSCKKSAIEHCSPCPYCQDGNDRLILWANKANGGRFWCRVCDKKGDAINLLSDHQGLTYRQACEMLKIKPAKRNAARKEQASLIAENPPDLWIEKATAFVEWSHSQLLQSETFLSVLAKRGLTLETIKAFKLGYNPSRLFRQCPEWGMFNELKEGGEQKRIWFPPGVVVPTFEGDTLVKVKIRNASFERELENYNSMKKRGKSPKYQPSKYVVIKGSKKCPSVYGKVTLDTLLILESELDAILICQEVDDLCFCLALGGSRQPLDLHKERVVRGVDNLLFCPDFDKAGKESWDRWIKRFPDTKRILTPEGKDPTDAFAFGINLYEWIKGA